MVGWWGKEGNCCVCRQRGWMSIKVQNELVLITWERRIKDMFTKQGRAFIGPGSWWEVGRGYL